MRPELEERLGRVQRHALLVGGAATVISVLGWIMDPAQFYQSYLLAFLFWIALPLGGFGFVVLHNMTGGGWGFVIRRILESAAGTISLMALLFLPLLAGLQDLYPWARPDVVAGDALLQHKEPYLNAGFFVMRAAVYFGLWIGAVWLVGRWSHRQDESADPGVTRRLQLISGAGLPVYGLTVTFASIDWAMSLEPHWFSTIYGMLFVAGQGLATLAFAIVVLSRLHEEDPLAGVVRTGHFHDLGNLTLAFVMLWAYLAFSQYLIIWSGNLPEEITWYLHRGEGGWELVGMALMAFHFAVPFLVLLSRRAKRSVRCLVAVALWILAFRWVDMLWMVAPAFHPGELTIHWLDVSVTVALGGLWIAAFCRQLGGWKLLPENDPRLGEVLDAAEAH